MVHGKNTELMVSVIMVTYGHEKYIEEAINGVFIQQTDFPVELIIANDCSPDQTDKIIKSLIPKSPENVTVNYTKHEYNKGANSNFLWAISQATGKYIALCEGDDYWIDPLKLQKQVDFLEENASAVACQHHRYFLKEGKLIPHSSGVYVYTQCLVFRNIIDRQFLEFFARNEVFNGDTFLENFLKLNGNYHQLNFYGAIYRHQPQGVYSQLDETEKVVKVLSTFQSLVKFIIEAEKAFINKKTVMRNAELEIVNCVYYLTLKKQKSYTIGLYLATVLKYKSYRMLEVKRLVHIIKTWIK